MLVHFTIPIRFGHVAKGCNPAIPGEEHPIVPEATSDDWFDVEVTGTDDYFTAEEAARIHVNQTYGNTGWMSTYPDGERWDALRKKWYGDGRCVVTLEVQA